jgi:hypothetical protein
MSYTSEQFEIATRIVKELKMSGVFLYVDSSEKIQVKSTSLRELTKDEQTAIEKYEEAIVVIVNSEVSAILSEPRKVIPRPTTTTEETIPILKGAVVLNNVETFNGQTGNVIGVDSVNGETGAVEGVNSVNGATGDVYVVSSFNGLTGSIKAITGVSSVGGLTGDVPAVVGPTGATGPVGNYVESFNGSTGEIIGVSSVNGATGDVTFTDLVGVNTWNGLSGDVDVTSSTIHVGGISADGGATFANDVNVNDLTIGKGGGDISTNTALGYQALYGNTGGHNNIASGYYSLYNNTMGSQNVASGNVSLYNNTVGNYNVASGQWALYSNTVGNYNVASGYKALYGNTGGDSNVSVGYDSGRSIVGSNNTAIGKDSGYDRFNDYTGNNNTFIGHDAQPSSISASNEVVIGDSNVTLIHSVAGMSMGGGATFGGVVGITGSGNHIQFPDGTTQGTAHTQTEEIIGINVDNGSSVLTTGTKGHRVLPYDCEVTEWTVTSIGSAGDIQWDVNWVNYANWPNGLASVAGSDLPNIPASGKKNQDTSVGWTKTTFKSGDILQFEIDSVTTLTNCNLALKIRSTS